MKENKNYDRMNLTVDEAVDVFLKTYNLNIRSVGDQPYRHETFHVVSKPISEGNKDVSISVSLQHEEIALTYQLVFNKSPALSTPLSEWDESLGFPSMERYPTLDETQEFLTELVRPGFVCTAGDYTSIQTNVVEYHYDRAVWMAETLARNAGKEFRHMSEDEIRGLKIEQFHMRDGMTFEQERFLLSYCNQKSM